MKEENTLRVQANQNRDERVHFTWFPSFGESEEYSNQESIPLATLLSYHLQGFQYNIHKYIGSEYNRLYKAICNEYIINAYNRRSTLRAKKEGYMIIKDYI